MGAGLAELHSDVPILAFSRIHRAVKQRLLAKVNLEINSVSEKFKSSLRLSELQHLPMLIKEKRASRNAKSSDDLFLKFFTEN